MIWTRQDLETRYEEILSKGLTHAQKTRYAQGGGFSSDVVVQSSGGSSGRPVLHIPRSRADIFSLYEIVLSAYESVYEVPAQRVALLGGVSHSQAALKFTAGGTRFESFSIDQRAAVEAFCPDFLSCYPSIARELAADPFLNLPELKAIKLGGEHVFASDIASLMARFPGVCIIEQLGSTEMPGMAIGVYCNPEDPKRLKLQTHRYTFFLNPHSGWQPLIIRDNFPELLFPIPGFFDTGDDVKLTDGEIREIRRRGDPANAYLGELDEWFRRGCVTIQIDRAASTLKYLGSVQLPPVITLGSQTFQTRKENPHRLPGSNKAPLVL